MKIKLFFCGMLSIVFHPTHCQDLPNREISFSVNPNCTKNCDKPWLVYGRGESENNTLHYLWSSVKVPTFVLAISKYGSKLNVNWTGLEEGTHSSILFSPLPDNVFGISFQSLILFNDENDTGKFDNITEENKIEFDLSHFEWIIDDSNTNSSSPSNLFKFKAVKYNDSSLTSGTDLSFSISVSGTSGRSDKVPHLIFTPNSAQLEVFLQNVTFPFDEDIDRSRDFTNPRWVLDTVMMSTDSLGADSKDGFRFEDKKSLNDEHTPGIFHIHSITTEGARVTGNEASSNGAFLQWRPVCYLTSGRDINFSSSPHANTSLPAVDEEHIKAAEHSLFFALFGDKFVGRLNTQVTFSFGLPKDGFYTAHNYTVWTMSMGLGVLPQENFSAYAIVLIVVGAGLPLLLFIVGQIYLVVRGRRNRGELLLGEN